MIRNLTVKEQQEIQCFERCMDADFQQGLDKLLHAMLRRYGRGYDRLKALSNMIEGLERDWIEPEVTDG